MDKKTIAVVIVCVLLLLFWTKIMEFLGVYKPVPVTPPAAQTQVDSTKTTEPPSAQVQAKTVTQPDSIAKTLAIPVVDSLFEEKEIVVTTPNYVLRFTNRGGGMNKIMLRKYFYQDSNNVILAESKDKIVPDFETNDQAFSSKILPFTTTGTDFELKKGDSPQTITYTYDNGKGGRIIKTYTIKPDAYDIDFDISVEGIETFGFERSYQLVWGITPASTEKNKKDDYGYYKVVARMGGKKYEFDDFDDGRMNEHSSSDLTEWVATTTKYFTAVMIPRNRNADGIIAQGTEKSVKIDGKDIDVRKLRAALDMPMRSSGNLSDTFTIYIGPIHYQGLKKYGVGLEELTSLGWKYIIEPFSIGIIWLLPKMYNYIPNYGVVVLLFSLLIKLITFPLSRKQTAAMAKMKDLQPKMKKLQEKFKNDPQRLNKEMMKLYKEAGANPLSGCLPMLPQMPLFFALFRVFKTTIEFRGAYFVGWITDLAAPDPLYILPIIMTVSMFVQQKMTMTDPKNKMMVYLMPLFFGYLFMNFPAGLVLYWTGYNVLSLVEVLLVKKQQAAENPQVMDA